MSDPEDKSLFSPLPKEITELILSQSPLLTKDPVTFRLLEEESEGFRHDFWKKTVYSLFPHITVYNPPSKTATPKEEAQFWKSLISKIGALFIKSIKNPELKKLYKAIFRGDLRRVKEILNESRFDKTDLLLFSDAIRTKEFLLPQLSSASLACALGRKEILSAFYAWATNYDTQINLWWACALNQYALLARKKAEITNWNQPILYDATPLWIACQQDHLDVVNALINAHADVNQARTTNGSTPLYIACQNGHLDVVQELIISGAEVNKACTDGTTPLWIACQNGHLGVVKTLITASAQVNLAQTYNGATPLYIACKHGHLDVVKTLIAAGANVNQAKTTTDTTPYDIARKKGHTQIARLLKARAPMNALDEPSVLEQFRHYASKFNKQLFPTPLVRFFGFPIGNHFADIVQQAFLQEQNPSLIDFLDKLKTIAAEKNINLRAYRSGELNALLTLSDMVLGEPFATLKPAGNTETQQMPKGAGFTQ